MNAQSRSARRFAVLVLTATVMCAAGCDAESQRAAGRAFGEAVYQVAMKDLKKQLERELTPVMVASVVGEFAPGGTPAVLNGLLADAWWDDRLQTIISELEQHKDIFPRSPLTPVSPQK
jgi:hypothetical protein